MRPNVDPTRPVISWPARERRALEQEIFVTLAGPVGELFVPHSGFVDRRDERDAERVARSLARLGPTTRAALAHAEARDEPFESDDARAGNAAFILAGRQEAGFYLGWARMAVQRLLAEHGPQLSAVVDALSEREVLSGHQMRALLARQRKERRAA